MRVLLVSEGWHERAGALEALVRRVAARIQSCEWDKVTRDDIHTHRGKGQGFFKRAVRWMLEARKRGYDALVLVIDEDGRRERLSELESAQQEDVVTSRFSRALGAAVRTFDAWMLADEQALCAVLSVPVNTQPSPEHIVDPKSVCAALLEQSGCHLSQRELYAKVAEQLDVGQLEQRCPIGFGSFAERLRSL
jgi:hypothetical protein